MIRDRDPLAKSTALAATPRFVLTTWPGQVPDKDRIEALRLAQQAPPPFSVERLLRHDGAYLSPASVVDGLGLDAGKRNEWVAHLSKAVRADNELVFRQEILGKMLHDRMDGALRQALFQRSMGFYRDMHKSRVSIATDLRKSGAAEVLPPRVRLQKAIYRRVRRAVKGLPLGALQDLVKSYGVSAVAGVLKEACGDRGGLEFRDRVLIERVSGQGVSR